MPDQNQQNQKPTLLQSEIVAIVDTREQTPLNLEKYGLKTSSEALPFGDYSLKYPSLRDTVIIERKNIADFVACCGRERKRFEKELVALRSYKYRMVLCEFTYAQLRDGAYRSKISENAVTSSLARWSANQINFVLVGTHEYASKFAADYLRFVAQDICRYAAVFFQKK